MANASLCYRPVGAAKGGKIKAKNIKVMKKKKEKKVPKFKAICEHGKIYK